MKRIIVNAYEVAMVYKRGRLVDVLPEGKYWVGFGKSVTYYDMTQPFLSDIELTLLSEHYSYDANLRIETVADNEIAFEMKNGLFNRVLKSCRIGYWDGPVKYELEKYNLNDVRIPDSIDRNILKIPQVLAHVRIYVVESYQKGLEYIDGKFTQMLEPGVYYYWKSDKIATINSIDTRIQPMEVCGQEILTKDKAGIRINFQAQYQVVDLDKAIIDTKDYMKQLYTNFQMILREYVGTMTLDQLLANKESIGTYVLTEIESTATELGVKVISGGIKDIILPGDVKEIMNQVLIAQKKAQANSIMRHEETASTRSLLNTAKLMDENKMLLKLKELEYMEKIADKVGQISVNGGSQVMDQLTELFVGTKS